LIRISIPALFLLVASAVSAAAPVAASEWYVNMKYGFSVAYQREIFLPQGESADGRGQKFRSGDGKAIVSAYGQDATGNSTLVSFFNETLLDLSKGGGWKVTHKSIKGDTFILQGTNGAASFYKKVVFKQRARQFVIFEAVCDAAGSKSYESVISSMAGSIKILQAAGAGG
jgi:hypothetical protein